MKTVELPFTVEKLEQFGTTMTESQIRATLRSCNHYGGNFFRHLSQAALAADPRNRSRILSAFPEVIAKFGPGSSFYDENL